MKKIADFFLRILLTNSKFNSTIPISDQNLLLPDFVTILNACIVKYKQTYPSQDITFTETYRSNALQEIHYNNGASKIKKNGMHHYGIAADSIFIINGKKSYKGDINLIRKIYKDSGLTTLGMWDPLHVQYISVDQQQELRNTVSSAIIGFQKKYNLTQTGEENAETIAKAKSIFLQ